MTEPKFSSGQNAAYFANPAKIWFSDFIIYFLQFYKEMSDSKKTNFVQNYFKEKTED